MRSAARTLFLFSLASFVGVVAFATVLGPAHKVVHSPDAVRSLNLFHSHFDQLCWLGAAALAAVLQQLAPSYSGPAWAPPLLARTYVLGTVTFAGAFLLRFAGQHASSAALARFGFAALASIGGMALVAAAGAAVAIAWAVARRPAPDVTPAS